MNIRIESLTANGLGPIASIKWQFKDINLIYGRNEQGKTFLAEYLLASLFRGVKSARPLTESGQVNLTGLSGQSTRLDPKSKKKLEDHLFQGGGRVVGQGLFSQDHCKGVNCLPLWSSQLSRNDMLDVPLFHCLFLRTD